MYANILPPQNEAVSAFTTTLDNDPCLLLKLIPSKTLLRQLPISKNMMIRNHRKASVGWREATAILLFETSYRLPCYLLEVVVVVVLLFKILASDTCFAVKVATLTIK